MTGGADSIDAGAGNDSITVGADHASIVTGAGNDTVNISAEVTTVTLEDLNSNDALTISGTFEVGSAKIDDTILVVTDKTGTRQIRLGDFDNAKNARINGTTIANWLSNAGIDINNLESGSASVVEESAPLIVEETGGGRVDVERKPESDTRALANTADAIQDLGGTGNAVSLGNVTITGGSVTNGGNKLGDISNAFPNISTFTKRGLTINLLGTSDKSGSTGKITSKTLGRLTDDQKKIVAGLFKWWAKECLKLNEESYGIGFKSDTAMVKEIGLFLYDSQGSGNTLATVWTSSYSNGTAAALKLSVNMNYYAGISEDNVDGQSSKTSAFLDRTLSHELTHAVMGANVKFFSKLPQFISEGMAELTHGIDDERYSRIQALAYDASKLTKALDLTNTSTDTADAYAGGYMFLRYFARQAALQSVVVDSPNVITLTEGDDTYQNTVEGATIQALGGNDSITNSGASVSIYGGTGDDNIFNNGSNVSISGGDGDDVISNHDSNVTIDGGDGDDSIDNSGDNVTIDGGEGNDLVSIGSITENVTINGGAGDDTIDIGALVNNISINVGAGDDSIDNIGSNATITGGAGDDTVYNSGNNAKIDLGDGNDFIRSFWSASDVTIDGGAGNDSVTIILGSGGSIDGGAGDDTIENEYANNVTIDGGDGNDTINSYSSDVSIDGGAGKDSIVSDGNDLIDGFNADSVLQISDGTGTYSKATLDNGDVEVTVGDGKVTLVGAALVGKVNIQGTEASVEPKWQLNGTTATYGTPDNTLITVSGVKSLDGISLNNKVVTISAASLGTSKVTISSGYTLALGTDAAVPKTVAASYDADTMTYTSAGKTEGYTLSNNAISYSTGTSKEFKFSGVADGATASNFYVSGTTITVGKAAVRKDGTPLKLLTDGYTLRLGKGMPTVPTTVAAKYDAKTMTYTSAGTVSYKLSSDAKSISTSGTSKQFKFEGIADGAVASNFYVSGTTLTIGKAAVKTDGTAAKLLSDNGYTLRLGKGMTAAATVGTSTLEDGLYTAAGQTAGYTLSNAGKTIAYHEALDAAFELDGIAAEPTTPNNGIVTLTPENFDRRLSVMNNEAEYAFSIANGTYTGKTFTGSSDADTITNAGANLIINAAKGNDSIENSGASVKVNAGLGNDYVKNSGANVTLNGGTGNDTLWGGSYADTFVYKSGDGNDVIGGFDDNDLLQITGTFTTAYDSAVGTVKFTVGTGSITLTDFTATTFNINSDAYQISGKTLVKK